jgi:predicted nuclease with RNAse H fold
MILVLLTTKRCVGAALTESKVEARVAAGAYHFLYLKGKGAQNKIHVEGTKFHIEYKAEHWY